MDKRFYVDLSRGLVIGIEFIKDTTGTGFKTQTVPVVDFIKNFEKNNKSDKTFWNIFAKMADARTTMKGDVNYDNVKKLFFTEPFARRETKATMKILMAHINLKSCITVAYNNIFGVNPSHEIYANSRKIPLVYTQMQLDFVDYDCQYCIDAWDKTIKYFWNEQIMATKKFDSIFKLNKYLLHLKPEDIEF